MIFITKNDVIGDALPLYAIDRQITNTGKAFDDGEHIIYVNGVDRDASTELGKLIHDFFCTDPNDMHYKELADKVRYFKEDEEWRPCVKLWKICGMNLQKKQMSKG